MARSSSPRPVATEPTPPIGDRATWPEERASAYEAARQEIALLRPGETILYHEGYLAIDAGHHAAIAGRAAAFLEAATEQATGVLAQRRVGPEWYQYVFRKSRE